MQKFIIELLQRFSSRKFIITIGGIVLSIKIPEQAGEIVTLCLGFIAAEGAADTTQRYQAEKTKQIQAAIPAMQDDVSFNTMGNAPAVDRGSVVPGQ